MRCLTRQTTAWETRIFLYWFCLSLISSIIRNCIAMIMCSVWDNGLRINFVLFTNSIMEKFVSFTPTNCHWLCKCLSFNKQWSFSILVFLLRGIVYEQMIKHSFRKMFSVNEDIYSLIFRRFIWIFLKLGNKSGWMLVEQVCRSMSSSYSGNRVSSREKERDR